MFHWKKPYRFWTTLGWIKMVRKAVESSHFPLANLTKLLHKKQIFLWKKKEKKSVVNGLQFEDIKNHFAVHYQKWERNLRSVPTLRVPTLLLSNLKYVHKTHVMYLINIFNAFRSALQFKLNIFTPFGLESHLRWQKTLWSSLCTSELGVSGNGDMQMFDCCTCTMWLLQCLMHDTEFWKWRT